MDCLWQVRESKSKGDVRQLLSHHQHHTGGSAEQLETTRLPQDHTHVRSEGIEKNMQSREAGCSGRMVTF